MTTKFEDIKSQDDLDKAIRKATTQAVQEATTSLTEKNTELLGEVKTLKKKVVPEDELEGLRKTATDYETLKGEKMKGNEEYERLLNESKSQHATEIEKRDARIAKMDKQLRETLVSGKLTKALTTAKVNPGLLDAAITVLSSKVSVIEKDDKQIALVGDKTIPDYVKDWAESDEGKHFVLAGGGGGGGTGGDGSGGGSGGAEFEKFFDPKNVEFNKTEQAKVYKKDPKTYEQLSKKFAGGQDS